MESPYDAGKNNSGRAATTCGAVATALRETLPYWRRHHRTRGRKKTQTMPQICQEPPGQRLLMRQESRCIHWCWLSIIINPQETILFLLVLIHCFLSLSPWYVAFALVTVRNDSGTFWLYRRCHPITVVPRWIKDTERDWATSFRSCVFYRYSYLDRYPETNTHTYIDTFCLILVLFILF